MILHGSVAVAPMFADYSRLQAQKRARPSPSPKTPGASHVASDETPINIAAAIVETWMFHIYHCIIYVYVYIYYIICIEIYICIYINK